MIEERREADPEGACRDLPLQVKEMRILNRLGIHARPAALLAKCASQFQASIRLQKDGLDVNGKSIMGIMMLAAAQGNVVRILAEGGDAEQALLAIEELIRNKFGEE
jgi:phosphocarrier protein HPr